MAVPVYTTDLATFDLAEGVVWNESTASGWTSVSNTVEENETDLFIQGTQCISTTVKTGVGILLANFGSGVTIPTDGAILHWMYYATPNSLDLESNGGIRTAIGSSLADFYAYTHGGSDTYVYGGWLNLATGDPAVLPTASFTVGTPTTVKQYAGWAFNAVTVPSKGNPYLSDAIRYGRCAIRATAGALADGYATFTGMGTTNDYNDVTNGYNRWGLFQTITPSSFLWKGLMSLGLAGTAVDFKDSNKVITVDNTKWVTANFNKVEINNASSVVDWSSISFNSLGTASPGRLEVVDNATVTIDSCSFADMDTFIFQSNSTLTSTAWRRCGLVTQGSATFTSCTFADSTNSPAMLSNNPQNITYTDFISVGTGHGMEINTAGTYSFTGNTWTGYSSGTDANGGTTGDANAAIHFNPTGGTGNLVLNISGGTTPSVLNSSTGTVTLNNGVALTLTGIQTDSEVRIINLDDTTNFSKELAGSEQIIGSVTKATIINGGSGYTNGAQTLTVVGGTGTAAQLNVTVSGGTVVSVDSIVIVGLYSVNPTNPVSVTGGGGTNATFRLTINGSFTYSYDASFTPNVAIIVFHLDYKEVRIEQNLAASNQSIPIQQTADRTYNNPL
jgi:hypothetical protein